MCCKRVYTINLDWEKITVSSLHHRILQMARYERKLFFWKNVCELTQQAISNRGNMSILFHNVTHLNLDWMTTRRTAHLVQIWQPTWGWRVQPWYFRILQQPRTSFRLHLELPLIYHTTSLFQSELSPLITLHELHPINYHVDKFNRSSSVCGIIFLNRNTFTNHQGDANIREAHATTFSNSGLIPTGYVN